MWQNGYWFHLRLVTLWRIYVAHLPLAARHHLRWDVLLLHGRICVGVAVRVDLGRRSDHAPLAHMWRIVLGWLIVVLVGHVLGQRLWHRLRHVFLHLQRPLGFPLRLDLQINNLNLKN